MAVFNADGTLDLIDSMDLMDTLDLLPPDELVNMNNARACLGVRTVARLLANDRAEVRFDMSEGTVTTADGTYTVHASTEAAAFIEAMIERQLNGPHDDEYFGIEVCELRDELAPYLDRNVYYVSLQP